MNESLRKFIVATSADVSGAEKCSSPCVQLIYRINESGILQRSQVYSSNRRSIMGIYDGGGLLACDIDKLIRDIIAEFSRRGYSAILLDIDDSPALYKQVEKLCTALSQRHILHFVPIGFSSAAKDAKLIIPSSISGGSIKEMLTDYTSRFNSSRLCLEIIRERNDFTMPSYKPEGTFLSLEEYNTILKQHSPLSFFSEELACKYFTYRTNGETHFVLFDDHESAAFKIRLAEQNGLYGVFILYSEWGDYCKTILQGI